MCILNIHAWTSKGFLQVYFYVYSWLQLVAIFTLQPWATRRLFIFPERISLVHNAQETCHEMPKTMKDEAWMSTNCSLGSKNPRNRYTRPAQNTTRLLQGAPLSPALSSSRRKAMFKSWAARTWPFLCIKIPCQLSITLAMAAFQRRQKMPGGRQPLRPLRPWLSVAVLAVPWRKWLWFWHWI